MRGHSVLEAAASELQGGRKFASSFSGPSSSSELSSSPRERWKMQHFLDFLRHKSSLSTTSSAQRTRDRRRFSLSVRCVGAVASVCAAATVLTVTTVVEPAWLAASPTTISPAAAEQRMGARPADAVSRDSACRRPGREIVPQAHVRRSLSTRLSRSWLRCMLEGSGCCRVQDARGTLSRPTACPGHRDVTGAHCPLASGAPASAAQSPTIRSFRQFVLAARSSPP